jgi:ribosomal protein S3
MQNKNLKIFTKKINKSYKLIPFQILKNDSGKIKYLPPISKEWKTIVYNFNNKNNINFPILFKDINSLIKAFFSSKFRSNFLKSKYISRRKKFLSYNTIFVSSAEVKHTNSKAIITVYVYNREKLVLQNKIKQLNNILQKLIISQLKLNLIIKRIYNLFNLKNLNNVNFSLWTLKNLNVKEEVFKAHKLFLFRTNKLRKKISIIFNILRKLKLRWNLNKFKFEDKILLNLSKLISSYLGKDVEFNLVNIKSLGNNNEILAKLLAKKLRKAKANPLAMLNFMLNKIKLAKINGIIERTRIEKMVDTTLLDNKYKNINLINIFDKNLALNTSISNKDNLDTLLNVMYNNSVKNKIILNRGSSYKLRNIILDNVKYKEAIGIKIRIKGRLTWRYRADRALFNLKWKGGLKNIDSAFKGLSTTVNRGFLDSNLEKSVIADKRRVGSYGVSSWLAGK